MQRRSFLGALASLPLLAGFKSQVMKDEAEQYYKSVPIKREPEVKFNDIDGATQRLLDHKLNFCSGSGTFIFWADTPVVACSGTWR